MKKWILGICALAAAVLLIPLGGCQVTESAASDGTALAPDEAIVEIKELGDRCILVTPQSEGPLAGGDILITLQDGQEYSDLGLEQGDVIKIKYSVKSVSAPVEYDYVEIQARNITPLSQVEEGELQLQPGVVIATVTGFGYNRMFVSLLEQDSVAPRVDMVVRPMLGVDFAGLEIGDIIVLEYSATTLQVPAERMETYVYAEEIVPYHAST